MQMGMLAEAVSLCFFSMCAFGFSPKEQKFIKAVKFPSTMFI